MFGMRARGALQCEELNDEQLDRLLETIGECRRTRKALYDSMGKLKVRISKLERDLNDCGEAEAKDVAILEARLEKLVRTTKSLDQEIARLTTRRDSMEQRIASLTDEAKCLDAEVDDRRRSTAKLEAEALALERGKRLRRAAQGVEVPTIESAYDAYVDACLRVIAVASESMSNVSLR